eukprot:11877589-Alexandrium_andersonii.AAC.1
MNNAPSHGAVGMQQPGPSNSQPNPLKRAIAASEGGGQNAPSGKGAVAAPVRIKTLTAPCTG